MLRLVTTYYAAYPSSRLAIDASDHHAYLASGTAVLSFTIQADGTLSAMTPVSVTPTAVSVVLSLDGHFVYVLSSCVDLSCDGPVELYTVDATGDLIQTGAAMNLGGHTMPVDLLIDCVAATPGSPASVPCTGPGQFGYLLTDSMGVDTNATSLFGYAIEPNGTLATEPLISEASPRDALWPHAWMETSMCSPPARRLLALEGS